MNSYEKEQLLLSVQAEIPDFKRDELIEYTKIILPNVHRLLCQGKNNKALKYCSQELINKLNANRKNYRLSTNIDNISVCHASLKGFESLNNKANLKVSASIFFYDDVSNNIDSTESFDKYWNDIWIVTYELNNNGNILNKCPSCGSYMEYKKYKHMFVCNYCRNNIYYSQIKWRITDIEVKND